jgi:syntaxin 6
MRAKVEGTQPFSWPYTLLAPNPNANISYQKSSHPEAYTERSRPVSKDDGEDHQKQWAREEQQMMMQEQDRTVDTISGTLSTLAQQVGLMGQEIEEHNECVCNFHLPYDHWC